MAEGPATAARAAGSGRDVATGGAVGEYCELPPNRVGAGCIGLKCSNRSRLCLFKYQAIKQSTRALSPHAI